MSSNDRKLNIYQKLSKIRKLTEAIQKNKKSFGYMYVSEDELLARITAGMDKYGISLHPSIVPQTAVVTPYHAKKTRVSKEGEVYEENINEIIVQADMEWMWINDENPEEKIVVPWFLVGQQDDSSKGFGSGLSYSSRYFLLKYFNVATVEDDPDNWRGKKKEAEKLEERETLNALKQEIIDLAKNKIDKGIKADDVYKIIEDNTGGKKNPNTIKDINTANKVLNLLKNMEVSVNE